MNVVLDLFLSLSHSPSLFHLWFITWRCAHTIQCTQLGNHTSQRRNSDWITIPPNAIQTSITFFFLLLLLLLDYYLCRRSLLLWFTHTHACTPMHSSHQKRTLEYFFSFNLSTMKCLFHRVTYVRWWWWLLLL